MSAKAEIIEGVSSKTGKEYVAVRIVIGDYEKLVYFLSKPEQALYSLNK